MINDKIERIKRLVCKVNNMEYIEFISLPKFGQTNFVESRQEVFWLLRETTKMFRKKMTMETIAKTFNKNRSSVNHSLEVINGRMEVDKAYNEKMNRMLRKAKAIMYDIKTVKPKYSKEEFIKHVSTVFGVLHADILKLYIKAL